MDHVNVPHAVRPSADQVVAVTDAVCRAHLDMEYADLCRAVVGKLGRKRPSPLTRGDLRIWAAGGAYQSDRASPTTRSPASTTTKHEAPAPSNRDGRLTLPLDRKSLHISSSGRRETAALVTDAQGGDQPHPSGGTKASPTAIRSEAGSPLQPIVTGAPSSRRSGSIAVKR